MKNKIFSRGLYVEGLRMNQPIGIGFTVIAVVLSLYDLVSAVSYGYMECIAHPVTVVLGVCFAAPLLCLSAFHFLNSRSSSDFYHSVPCTRTAMFFSYAASVATWAIGPMLIAFLTNVSDNPSGYFRLLVLGVLMCGQVIASVLLAMSLCSTVISQILVSLMIIFLPSGLVDIIVGLTAEAAPIFVRSDELGWLLDSSNNLCYANVVGSMIGTNRSYGELTVSNVLCTLGLTVLLGGIALICFNNRRSEIAASTAPNAVVQTAIRVLLALVFCLAPCAGIAIDIINDYGVYFEEYFLWYAFALVAYVMYEVLSQKGFRGLRRSWVSMIVGLVVLVVLNGVLIVSPMLCTRAICSVRPSAEEVESISVYYDSSDNNIYFYDTYMLARAASVEIDDDAIVGTVTGQLSDNIDTLSKRGGSSYLEGSANYDSVTFVIRLNDGSEITRNVYFDSEAFDRLAEQLSENAEFADAVCSMPTLDEISSISLDYLDWDSRMAEDNQLTAELYGTLVKEIDEIGVDAYARQHGRGSLLRKVYEKLGADMGKDDSAFVFTGMYVHAVVDGEVCHFNMDISTLFPKTAQAYVDYIATIPHTSLAETLEDTGDDYYLELYVDGGYLRDADGTYIYTETQYIVVQHQDGEMNDYFLESDLCRELLANEGKPVDVTKPFYEVRIMHYGDEDGGYYYDCPIYIQADENNPAMLDWIIGEDSEKFDYYVD